MQALLLKIGLWALVKAMESAADEYLDDGDAETMRTTIIEYIRARQRKAIAAENGFKKVRSRVWRYMSIVMASNRLDEDEAKAREMEMLTNSTRLSGPHQP
jgi:hypothetical protein